MGKFDKKPTRAGAAAPAGVQHNPNLPSNPELDKVAKFLLDVKFRPKTFGGVDPMDVWKKLEELNTLYENAIIAERVRYDMLLRQALRTGAAPNDQEAGYGET